MATKKKTTNKNKKKTSNNSSSSKKTASKKKTTRKTTKSTPVVPKPSSNKPKLTALAIIAVIIVIAILVTVFQEKPLAESKSLDLNIETSPDFKIGVIENGETIRIYDQQINYLKTLFEVNQLPQNKTQLFEEAVLREILYSNAIKEEITFDETNIEDLLSNPAFEQQISSLELTKEEFIEQFKEEIKKDYFIQEYFNNAILGNLPSEKMVEANHILICYKEATLCENNLTKEEALSLANDVKALAENNPSLDNFEELAKEYSTGPSGSEGGYLGTFGKGQMIPEFEDVAFDLENGEISDVVETVYGYHIIRVDNSVETPNSQLAISILTNLRNEILDKLDIKVN